MYRDGNRKTSGPNFVFIVYQDTFLSFLPNIMLLILGGVMDKKRRDHMMDYQTKNLIDCELRSVSIVDDQQRCQRLI